MTHFPLISEADLKLTHALQIGPRTPWSALGRILRSDPATLSRRWSRITNTGVARITAHPSRPLSEDYILAHIQLACRLEEAPQIARLLAKDADIFTIHLSSGEYPLIIITAALDLEAFTKYLLDRIGSIPQVSGSRVHIQTALLVDGSMWEIDALSNAQRQAIRSLVIDRSSVPDTSVDPEVDRRILEVLMKDGRASYVKIARESDVSKSTARRRVNYLTTSKQVTLRCDIARHAFGYPVAAYLYARSDEDIEPISNRIRSAVPEIRVLTMITGVYSLHIYLWLRRASDLPMVERRIREVIPDLVIGERSILLRTVKQIGHVLDPTGKTDSIVPTDVSRSFK